MCIYCMYFKIKVKICFPVSWPSNLSVLYLSFFLFTQSPQEYSCSTFSISLFKVLIFLSVELP